MTVDLPSSVDITHLPLREGALAIRASHEFAIGTAFVNYTALLGREGMTHRGLALEEARALGQHMLSVYRHQYDPRNARILRVEPKRTMAPGNVVLKTIPVLDTKLDKTSGRLVRPHSWTFNLHAITQSNRPDDLFSVSFEGNMGDGSDDDQEAYHRSMRGLTGGPITAERLRDPSDGEPEDPNDLFYVAELGLLRAARLRLDDRLAKPMIQ
jgi:hypothetical protein